MIKLLNTIGCDTNLPDYKIEMMDVEDRILMSSSLFRDIKDYDNDDEMLNVADMQLRYIADYIKNNNLDLYKGSSDVKIIHVLIDLESYMVKSFMDILDSYSSSSLKEMMDAGEDKDIATILKSMVIYVPVYNSHKNIAKAMVCINNI